MLTPSTPAELADALASAAARGQSISLGGNFTKTVPRGDCVVSTRALKRVLIFEPKDLTVSVEAGIPYAELTRLLDEHRMMVPLDPPLADSATVGGVVAANQSGPRRRLYGTARDLAIGMSFAMLDGKIASTGGMVVKNVAGLDMGKLLIGSRGTLAAIASVNFKLIPKPPESRTFLFQSDSLDAVLAKRDAVLRSPLQPAAIDVLSPPVARACGLDGWCLLLDVGGSPAVLARYSRELPEFSIADPNVWNTIRDLAPRHLDMEWAIERRHLLMELGDTLRNWNGPALARAGSGVTYLFGKGPEPSAWPEPGPEFAVMRRIKDMFDPQGLLNRGALYGRL